jgi:hypothetical protein
VLVQWLRDADLEVHASPANLAGDAGPGKFLEFGKELVEDGLAGLEAIRVAGSTGGPRGILNCSSSGDGISSTLICQLVEGWKDCCVLYLVSCARIRGPMKQINKQVIIVVGRLLGGKRVIVGTDRNRMSIVRKGWCSAVILESTRCDATQM